MREFIQRLLSFDGSEVGERSFRFGDPWPGIVTILVIAGLAALFRHLYRTEHAPRATPRYRSLLACLRCAAAFVLVFMLFRPLLVMEKTEERESYVVVLIDDSLSMSLKDRYDDQAKRNRLMALSGAGPPVGEGGGGGEKTVPSAASPEVLSRAELVHRILNNREVALLPRLAKNSKLQVYSFSETVQAVPLPVPETPETARTPADEGPTDDLRKPDSPGQLLPQITPTGFSTRLGDAITRAANELRGQQIAAMVVISDGQSNTGRSPEESVEDSAVRRVPPFPVLTVGVGSPQAPRDLEVLQVLADEAVFVNDEVIFSVLVRNQGFDGQNLVVQLRQDGEVVGEIPVELPTDGSSKEMKIPYSPRTVGQFTFEVLMPPREDETVRDNNSRTHLMRVVDEKVRVLYVADQPSWEYRYLKNALIRDHTAEVSCILQSADAEFIQEGDRPIQRFPAGKEELFQFDVVIFTDADLSQLNDTQVQALVGFVEDLGGGILFAAGPDHRLDTIHATPLEKLLPVVSSPESFVPSGPATEPFRLKLTPEGVRHPILRMEGDPDANTERWGLLPGFYWYLPVRGAKPGALVLAVHPHEKNDSGNHAILAAEIYGAGRTIFLATNSTWRWRHLVGDTYFYRFWGQSIRFLSAGRLLGQNKRLHIMTDRDTYPLGDEVVVSARLLDEMYRPVVLQELPGEARDDTGSKERIALEPVPQQAGNYKGTFRPKAAGKYEIGIQEAGETPVVSRPFMVKLPSVEFDHPEMNEALLRRLATISGGEFFPLEEIDSVPSRMSQIRESIVTEVEDDLWDSPALLAIFALLVILEWSLRKYRMMV